jgi:ATP adenylyltransferase
MTLERLYTPWRMKYVTSAQKNDGGCVFCAKIDASAEHDRENYVIYRGDKTFAVMNIYPYNTGHIMILPHTHVATLAEVRPETQFELITLIAYFTDLLSQLMNPDGFNIGLNIGQAAGAGIDSHLHIHIVPRWTGDSNYMPVIGQTKVLPEELGDTYDKIVAWLKKQPPQMPPLSK